MRNDRMFSTIAVLRCFYLVVETVPAYGYTDPNTVGLLSQMLTPLLLTAAATFTFFRKRVQEIFTRLTRRLRRRNDGQGV